MTQNEYMDKVSQFTNEYRNMLLTAALFRVKYEHQLDHSVADISDTISIIVAGKRIDIEAKIKITNESKEK